MEFSFTEFYRLNYSAFSDAKFRNAQRINPANGLIEGQNNSLIGTIQSLCDQSTIKLLLRLYAGDEITRLNMDLPLSFEESDDVHAAECSQFRSYGLGLARDMNNYHVDCWAYCTEHELVGFRKGLGGGFDTLLDNGADYHLPLRMRNISNVMIRLLSCLSNGWFDSNASDVVFGVLQMCASSQSCARLCGGISNSTDAEPSLQLYLRLIRLIAQADPQTRSQVLSPGNLPLFMQPISVVSGVFTNTMTEDSVGSVVPAYIDFLANPETGQCRGYDAAMSAFLGATGGDLSPFPEMQPSGSLPKVRAVRSAVYAACQGAIQAFVSACTLDGVRDLCERAARPDVATLGSFETCDDAGLGTYWSVVSGYNTKCGNLGFPVKPTGGPSRSYFTFSNGITMEDCFQDKNGQILLFFLAFTTIWIECVAYLVYARRNGEKWLATCDFILDVSRSRAFTVCGTLWLLYFFYHFYFNVLNINLYRCTKPWPDCGGFYFPGSVYFALLCLVWIAAFASILVANNPYCKYGQVLALPGVALSHFCTFLVAAQCLEDVDLKGNTLALRSQKFFQIGLISLLQLGLDISFAFLCIGRVLGWKTFHNSRGDVYSKHISSALNWTSTENGARRRILVTFGLAEGDEIPTAGSVEKDLATLAGSIDNILVVSMKDEGQPQPSHSKRARELKLNFRIVSVYSVEILVVKSRDDKILYLQTQERNSMENGHSEDAEQYKRQWLQMLNGFHQQ